jgi:class 3 adenylate cyclase/predicted metal-dependent HD superfamily phosphohydrolase
MFNQWWFWSVVSVVLVLTVIVFIIKRIDISRRKQVFLEMKIAERTREIRIQNIQIEKQRRLLEDKKQKLEEQQALLQIEKDKTEKILKNVIPAAMVDELMLTGKVLARSYKMVSVIFTDFVGFTKIAERMSPTELVEKLDVYFRKFDEIIVNNQLEKIKTIGDAYMCAGGAPVENTTNAVDTCVAALQIQEFMRIHKNEGQINNTDFWELRLGINTGEVTAGVIGSERLAFDVWGATVNHAQRMEMLGEPGKVTITGSTFAFIEPFFECVYKGQALSKSKGALEMYTVERIKPMLSFNGQGMIPNQLFHQLFELYQTSAIDYYAAEKEIFQFLEQQLSKKLFYHSLNHTMDVVKATERLALKEGVCDESLLVLKAAALLHDAGFIEQYDKNEFIGVRFAAEILPKHGFTDQHIEQVQQLIRVTSFPHKPSNLLEEIICDADLDYLGRDDFHEIADNLRLELRRFEKIGSDRKWDEMQLDFLSKHRYFTQTAIDTRLTKKVRNTEEIKLKLAIGEYLD